MCVATWVSRTLPATRDGTACNPRRLRNLEPARGGIREWGLERSAVEANPVCAARARSSFISHGATQARRRKMRRVGRPPSRSFEEATAMRSSGTTPRAAQVRLRSRARARRAVRCRLRHPRDRSMPREVASAPHGHQGDAAAALALRACLPSVARALGLPSCLPDHSHPPAHLARTTCPPSQPSAQQPDQGSIHARGVPPHT